MSCGNYHTLSRRAFEAAVVTYNRGCGLRPIIELAWSDLRLYRYHPMKTPDLSAQRLRTHHLLKPDFESPAEVVRWFGAVQAQDYFGSLYAIGLRLPRATEGTIEKAVADRTIVRTWPMRGTIHYVPAEDVRWMLTLLARRRIPRNHLVYRRAGLTEADFEKAGKVLVRILSGGKLLTRPEVYQALDAAKIRTEPEQRGLHILGYWAQMGLICLGARRGKQTTITLLDDWIPDGRTLPGDQALAVLATRYFTSHGPATLGDFAWWSGLNAADARAALHSVRSRLVPVTVDGRTYWSGSADEPPDLSSPNIHLLPAYDEFTVAYRDRSAIVDPALGKKVGYALGPSIISDGRMVGRWKRTLEKDAVIIQLDLLGPLNRKQRTALEGAADHYGAFVGLPAKLQE